jgi:hypothetical protein
MAQRVALSPRELFGGGLRLMVPSAWLDTEQYMDVIRRPVPDNQEIFVAPPPRVGAGASAIGPDGARPLALFVDILEAPWDACLDISAAPRFHACELLRRDGRAAEADTLDAMGPHALAETVALRPELLAEAGSEAGACWAAFEACDLEVRAHGNGTVRARFGF